MNSFIGLAIFLSLSSGLSMFQIPDGNMKNTIGSSFHKKVYTSNGKELPYRIMYPENFDENKQYPILFFLHGAGERGNDNEKQLTHGAKLFYEKRKEFPAIVVFPQCATNDYWANIERADALPDGTEGFKYKDLEPAKPSMQLLEKLIDSLTALPTVDKSRIYIAGLSMGGMGTGQLLAKRPEFFAAGIVICGAAPLRFKENLAKTPTWIFHGTADPVVSPIHSKDYFKAIDDGKGKHKLTLYEFVMHNSWDYAFKEPDFMTWLFSHQLKK